MTGQENSHLLIHATDCSSKKFIVWPWTWVKLR